MSDVYVPPGTPPEPEPVPEAVPEPETEPQPESVMTEGHPDTSPYEYTIGRTSDPTAPDEQYAPTYPDHHGADELVLEPEHPGAGSHPQPDPRHRSDWYPPGVDADRKAADEKTQAAFKRAVEAQAKRGDDGAKD